MAINISTTGINQESKLESGEIYGDWLNCHEKCSKLINLEIAA
nr:hypothetical protein [Formosa haliotis]